MLLAVSFLAINFSNAQNLSRLWTSVYGDSTAGNLNISDMAVDANGNSYLTGNKIFSNGNYYDTHLFLLKINTAGTREWIRYFDENDDSIDAAYAVALDTTGNVYVTGKRVDTFCNICTHNSKISDIITMKYDGAGNRIWLNRYHDTIYNLASPADIVVSAKGTVIVTGNITSYNSETGSYISRMIVEKIGKKGETLWIRSMKSVVANSACFDNNSDILVAGASSPDNLYQTQKPMVLKFSSSGNLLWSSIYNEYGKNGQLYRVYCDSLNNVYANGQTDTLTFYNNPRIITIKYNAAGKQKWFNKETDHTTTMPHYYGDFIADASGNCYITGFVSKSSADDDWLTTKYNSNGNRQWLSTFDDAYHGSDKPVGIAAAKNGNVYVNGYVFNGSGNYSIATVAYSNSGAQLDSDIYKSGSKSNGFGAGVGLDKKSNIYVSGEIGFYNNPYPNLIVIKYGNRHAAGAVSQQIKQSINISVYPNPVKNIINISFTASAQTKYKFVISDLNGNELLAGQLSNSAKTYNAQADVHNLHTGIYTLKISDGFNVVSKPFLKE